MSFLGLELPTHEVSGRAGLVPYSDQETVDGTMVLQVEVSEMSDVRMASVLIAVESNELRRLIATALQLDGHHAEEAADGHAALAALLRRQPDVAILDALLPELAGATVCRIVRRHDAVSQTGIIILSNGPPDDEVLACDADAIFPMPFSPIELLAAVRQLAARARTNGD
jgi:DNA-binding response OmpR family regulator